MEEKIITPLDKERLQVVKQFITDHGDYNENNWKLLYAKVQEEYNIEWLRMDDMNLNPYLNNLRQTIEKQANEYLHAPKTKKATAYKLFIDHFEQDVQEAMWL